jgi:hypothetical protein
MYFVFTNPLVPPGIGQNLRPIVFIFSELNHPIVMLPSFDPYAVDA